MRDIRVARVVPGGDRQVKARRPLTSSDIHRCQRRVGWKTEKVRYGSGDPESRPVSVDVHARSDAQPTARPRTDLVAGDQAFQNVIQAGVVRPGERNKRADDGQGGTSMRIGEAFAAFVPGRGNRADGGGRLRGKDRAAREAERPG